MPTPFITKLHKAVSSLQQALNDQIEQHFALAENQSNIIDVIESTPADISARYWLMQLLAPLNRADLKSVVDGFLVQMLNEEQAKKLVKFLLVRFPNYYKDIIPSQPEAAPSQPAPAAPAPTPVP